ncbi:MAG: hypothetical protein LIP18_06580, partial [Planctomycetes bacterium]|nr:hypothetical protein [Planctomycetota bacterium]
MGRGRVGARRLGGRMRFRTITILEVPMAAKAAVFLCLHTAVAPAAGAPDVVAPARLAVIPRTGPARSVD